MFDFVEPRVRRVVAEQLGVNVEELTPDVSLTDDLAADSLDLLELTLALEAEFGIVVSESALERVRTYGDLRGTVRALLHQRHEADARSGVAPLEAWARVVSSRGEASAEIQRVGLLTPYTAETIAEDALRAGPGAQRILGDRSEEHTSELQSPCNLVCRLLLEKKKT